jgi:prepilin-type N-terminal cleavage/methylation domain-containing protein
MKRRAFTLAEVAVAIALLGLAAFAFGRAVVDSLEAINHGAEQEDIRLFQILRGEVLNLSDRAQVEAGGEIEFPALVRTREREHETQVIRLQWEAEVFPTQVLNVFAVRTRIRFLEDQDRPGDLPLNFFVYRPRWATSEERDALVATLEQTYSKRAEERGQSTEE